MKIIEGTPSELNAFLNAQQIRHPQRIERVVYRRSKQRTWSREAIAFLKANSNRRDFKRLSYEMTAAGFPYRTPAAIQTMLMRNILGEKNGGWKKSR